MKIAKKCRFCGSGRIHTETGIETTRCFDEGMLVSESSNALPRRVFCDSCYEEL